VTEYFTVSQTEASERLHDEGLEVVGWYHSHPTFFPNPSLQDLDTQSHMQEWFAKTASAPLVGFILSPYCPTSRTSASDYRYVSHFLLYTIYIFCRF
jgi:protein MYSM1